MHSILSHHPQPVLRAVQGSDQALAGIAPHEGKDRPDQTHVGTATYTTIHTVHRRYNLYIGDIYCT